MVSSPADTWATNTILLGFSRAGSTLNATGNGWDQALPFDTGSSFSGYARTCSLGTFTIAKVHLFECEVGAIVVWATSSAMVESMFGLLLDPGVSNSTSPSSAEATSGCRYFFRTCGGTTATSTTSWTSNVSATASAYLAHSTTANNNHCFAVNIGAATLTAAERAINALAADSSSTMLTPDNDAVFAAIQIGPDGGGGGFGRLREVCIGPQAKIGQTGKSSGTAVAYAVSASPSADAATLWCLA